MRTLLPLLLAALLFCSPVYAKPKQTYKQMPRQSTTVTAAAEFSPAERHMIRSYLANQSRKQTKKQANNLPYGLQKKLARGKSLPPGWQQKVTLGRSLDYQIYRYGVPLPQDLLAKLPPGPSGSQIIQVDQSIIRLNTATRAVLDIFDLVQNSR